MTTELPPCPLDGINLSETTIEAAITELFEYAAALPASDVFLSAHENSVSVSVRHLGTFKRVAALAAATGRNFINHVKATADMDVAQRRRPADGRWLCPMNDGRKLDVRVSTIPTLYGEDMAIRLLDSSVGLMQLSTLGFHRTNFDILMGLLQRPSGLILITGPAGAGKTTTLYSCLQHLNDGTRKINTIEDPIEYVIDGIRQSQVHLKIRLGFPELLISVLRQSPDVIMVGEIRDPITAETAVRAANSGQLVFATLHAPIAAGAIDSMLALDVVPYFLSTCLIGVISQRLVRTLCEDCKMSFDLTAAPQTFDDIKQHLEPGQGECLHSAPGCDECHGEGFTNRTGVVEVLRVTNEIRQMIVERRRAREINDMAVSQGMLDLRRSALLKVAQGITSTEEVVRRIPMEYLLPHD